MPPKHARGGGPHGDGMHRGGGGMGGGGMRGGGGGGGPKRKKSLLIGINYIGSQHALAGCLADIENVGRFLSNRGYSSDAHAQLVLRDDQPRNSHYYPNGANMIAAMQWLVSEPNTTCFMHYSGHGGQIPDPDGDRSTGFDDTIVPADFETKGQLSSDILHKTLISRLPPSSTLFVVLDCCHSGSALELPYVYRSDSSGNVNMMDNIAMGKKLLGGAMHLVQGGQFNVGEAIQLFGGATDFFRSAHTKSSGGGEDGLEKDAEFTEDWAGEKKHATMFSGCQDAQTSADANIGGKATGAMSWAFLQAVRSDSTPTYSEILQATRKLLDQSHYEQIPQLSMGIQMDVDAPLML